jgi:hypothetical protein
VTADQDFRRYVTPDGELFAVEQGRYLGILGQQRIVLVDRVGRVHHYDVGELEILEPPKDSLGGTPPGEPA